MVYESAAVTIGEYELNDMRKDILHRLCSELTITVDEQSLMNMSFSDAGIDSIIYLGLIAKFEDIYDVMFDECALHGVNFYRISDFVVVFVIRAHNQVAVLTTNDIISRHSGIVNNVFAFCFCDAEK